jgi:hypothetical protein
MILCRKASAALDRTALDDPLRARDRSSAFVYRCRDVVETLVEIPANRDRSDAEITPLLFVIIVITPWIQVVVVEALLGHLSQQMLLVSLASRNKQKGLWPMLANLLEFCSSFTPS